MGKDQEISERQKLFVKVNRVLEMDLIIICRVYFGFYTSQIADPELDKSDKYVLFYRKLQQLIDEILLESLANFTK